MLKKYGLYLAWLISCLGVLGSLYFSELHHLEPCHLCWFQRIALYPLALLLGIAVFRGDGSVVIYAMPLAVIGFILAGYHVMIQEFPHWQPLEICGAGPDCAEKVDIGLGPITIPMLSAAAFATIFVCLYGQKWSMDIAKAN